MDLSALTVYANVSGESYLVGVRKKTSSFKWWTSTHHSWSNSTHWVGDWLICLASQVTTHLLKNISANIWSRGIKQKKMTNACIFESEMLNQFCGWEEASNSPINPCNALGKSLWHLWPWKETMLLNPPFSLQELKFRRKLRHIISNMTKLLAKGYRFWPFPLIFFSL